MLGLRRGRGWGPHRIAWALGMAPSTAYAVLRRAGLHRRDRMHRVSREAVRYERDRPGELLHLDVKKLGRVPPGGGKRFSPGFAETRSGPRGKGGGGIDCVHVAVDDHSRYAYAEVLPDERGVTTAAFLERAIAFFADLGIRIERVITDNGANYLSGVFRGTAAALGAGAAADAAVPAADQRQGRGVHQDPAERVGLRAPLHLERGAAGGPPGLPARVQSRPSARRHRRGGPRLPPVNNVPGTYS